MRKDTPIGTQLPEWKKEVAEKVKAYGERKKRLTTPPQPLKESGLSSKHQEIPVKQTISLVQEEPDPVKPQPVSKGNQNQRKPASFNSPAVDPVAQPAIEIWPEDIQELTQLEKLNLPETDHEVDTSGASNLSRRIGAGLIDHTILLLITGGILFGFSIFLNQSMEWMILSAWKGSLFLFLLLHFIYHLYFFKSSRQTPGLLFVSLELRDPVLSSIPFSKLLIRWVLFVVLNIFNFLPLILGKEFLLLDRLSGTKIRSFH